MTGRDTAANSMINIPRGGPLHQFVLQVFAATGHSPSTEQIRDHFFLGTLEEADAMVADLERAGSIHRDPGDGAITHAYPFSNEPTAHRVFIGDGPEVYAMCAIDAVGMPFMLRRNARITSTCPPCAVDIAIEIRDGDLISYAPLGTVAWLGQIAESCVTATDLCPDLNFFCSAEHLREWASLHPEKHGLQLGFDETLALGRRVFENLLYPASDRG